MVTTRQKYDAFAVTLSQMCSAWLPYLQDYGLLLYSSIDTCTAASATPFKDVQWLLYL